MQVRKGVTHRPNSLWMSYSFQSLRFSCQMCGARLLGRERRGPGAHHHSRQSHVHRHPVQGEHVAAECCGGSVDNFIVCACPLVLTLSECNQCGFPSLYAQISCLSQAQSFVFSGCCPSNQGDRICHFRVPGHSVL